MHHKTEWLVVHERMAAMMEPIPKPPLCLLSMPLNPSKEFVFVKDLTFGSLKWYSWIVMKTKSRPMQLTPANFEKYSWLFSPTLKLMVREHECDGGTWDVEVDGYKLVGGSGGKYEPDTNIFSSFDTIQEALKGLPELSTVRDWIHGDDVEFW